MKICKILSILLCYPEQNLIDNLNEIKTILQSVELNTNLINPLLDELSNNDLISLQEHYVLTFDRTPNHSLHLFEHIHGEDRMRGSAMVDLLNEYQLAGFEPNFDELPDYLPLFLEFLTICEPQKAQDLLGNAIHVISHIGKNLTKNNNIYAGIFHILEQLTQVKPTPLIQPPIKNMEEALEKFGSTIEGIEPLLQSNFLHSNSACLTCSIKERELK